MRVASWLFGFWIVLSSPVVASVAAQDTGGSFGGGDWSDSSSSSDFGSSGSDFGGSSDFGSGGSDYSGSYGTSGGVGAGGCCGVPAFMVLLCVVGSIVFIVVMGHVRHGNPRTAPPSQLVDVTALSLAIDWHARRALQDQLKRVASTSNLKTKPGLSRALSEIVLAVRRAEVSWLYAGARNFTPSIPSEAQRIFQGITMEMRARFQNELVRATGEGRDVRDGAARVAKKQDGEGVVVVTLVVAARRELLDLRNVQDASQMRAALNGLASLNPEGLVAFEVIWSPAQEEDRMSTLELEAIYPELKVIDPRSVVGRVQCAYCQGLFAAELLTCPHCGAPGPAKT